MDAGRLKFSDAVRVALLYTTAPISMWKALRRKMPQIVFDKFSSGLDRRKSRDTAGADALYELTNAQVSAGQELEKRACAGLYETIDSGTVGLFAALAKLNVFTTDATVSIGAPLLRLNFLPHPTNSVRTLARIHAVETFRGYLYVVAEYDDGSVFHHYLDAGAGAAGV